MKCPKCQFENPEGIIFCGKCASKLELICTKCNFSNPPDFIFCGKCAHSLSKPSEALPKDPSFDEKIEKIQKQGYSLMQEDFAKFQYNNRVECIAVPVKYMSTLYGSLNVGFLKTVINTDVAINKFLPIVKDMANKIGEHVYKKNN